MQIFVDADAFPNGIRDILMKASLRLNVPVIFVANKPLRHEKQANLSLIIVEEGPDIADDRIAELVQPGDLVITADIPLAADVIAHGAHALDPRGEMYSSDSIGSRLAMRDFMETLRSGGVVTGGPPAFNQADRKAFAGQLDKFLASNLQL